MGEKMEYRTIVRDIPKTMREMVAERFIDVLLDSDSADAVSPTLAKTILHYWQRDQLASEAGLINLTKAVMAAEPKRAAAILDDLGLEKTKLALIEIHS